MQQEREWTTARYMYEREFLLRTTWNDAQGESKKGAWALICPTKFMGFPFLSPVPKCRLNYLGHFRMSLSDLLACREMS